MRKFTLSAAAALTSMLTILTCPAYTYASSDHDFKDKNTDTGYQLIIDDEADFLTSDEEESLSEVMYETAGYCNAMVVTTTYHTFSSTEDFAVSTYENYFGKNSSGIVFVIDRDLNEIYLASEGDARKKITDSKCDVNM